MAAKKSATKTARPTIGSSHAGVAKRDGAPRKRPQGGTTGATRASGTGAAAGAGKNGKPLPGGRGARVGTKAAKADKATKSPRHDSLRGPGSRDSAAPKSKRGSAPTRALRTGSPAQRPTQPPGPPRPVLALRTEASEEGRHLALVIATAALDKKASNVQILDVVGRVDYADFLVLTSGRSDRHVLAIADGIEEMLVAATPKRKPVAVEGRPHGNWIVLDYGDVVAHVFQEEARSFYDLDALWRDARRIPLAAEDPRRKTAEYEADPPF